MQFGADSKWSLRRSIPMMYRYALRFSWFAEHALGAGEVLSRQGKRKGVFVLIAVGRAVALGRQCIKIASGKTTPVPWSD